MEKIIDDLMESIEFVQPIYKNDQTESRVIS